jgi:hypothetical protein
MADLVPFMLEAFLDGDADFRRACRAGGVRDTAGAAPRILEDRRTLKERDQSGENPRKN